MRTKTDEQALESSIEKSLPKQGFIKGFYLIVWRLGK